MLDRWATAATMLIVGARPLPAHLGQGSDGSLLAGPPRPLLG
ncbi:hypothetical protein [Antarcticirhabdus aurantiaca]|uniref:Uncharacterized protein n=1 Tax=Antarcticirhabdus aurantiaca TaxID=2606717 RepID=A0ACD4NJ02_9HYPH|nr:hypothetical protein [Antarcticirhabdus aurantiaca]WAJ26774.1 hypothetical protein OXU80_18135 [Jeongeuplla avenae]